MLMSLEKIQKGKSNSGEINKEIQLPVNEVTLNAYVIGKDPKGKSNSGEITKKYSCL